LLRPEAAPDDQEDDAMTAVITASRWQAIHSDYKTGSPTDGTAAILRLTTDRGTVLVPAEIVDRRRLFAFGPLVATPRALRALVAEGADPARLLSRHGAGDCGVLSADDHDANDEAVRNGERILSAYELGAATLWVITDAETDGPVGPSGVRPRYATTLLLPSEY
jgi:hypothetical protein